MKKTIKPIALVLTVISLFLMLASCSDRYVSSYSAIAMTRHNTTDRCSADFKRLSGTLVFKLRPESEGELHYAGALDEGEINVWYDIYGTKELLFNIKAGDTVDMQGGYVEGGKTVYVIIETVTESRGRIEVSA